MNYYGYEVVREVDLYHYGVPGMKWGIRRFEDASGGLTRRGQRRYYRSNVARGLNRLDKDIAKTKYKSAINKIKLQKAQKRGKIEKAEKYSARKKELSKSIVNGQKITNDILAKAAKNGVKISSSYVTRLASRGARGSSWSNRTAGFSNYLALPGVNISRGVSDRRMRRYGAEAGGYISGTKYKVVK